MMIPTKLVINAKGEKITARVEGLREAPLLDEEGNQLQHADGTPAVRMESTAYEATDEQELADALAAFGEAGALAAKVQRMEADVQRLRDRLAADAVVHREALAEKVAVIADLRAKLKAQQDVATAANEALAESQQMLQRWAQWYADGGAL